MHMSLLDKNFEDYPNTFSNKTHQSKQSLLELTRSIPKETTNVDFDLSVRQKCGTYNQKWNVSMFWEIHDNLHSQLFEVYRLDKTVRPAMFQKRSKHQKRDNLHPKTKYSKKNIFLFLVNDTIMDIGELKKQQFCMAWNRFQSNFSPK